MPGRRLDIDLEFLWLDQKAAREPPVALFFFFFRWETAVQHSLLRLRIGSNGSPHVAAADHLRRLVQLRDAWT
ncbi:hypothetical protein GQ607_005478 [Colletotrichum asianum]|uniref:Uncharacterized protein n=1 Tax=Colletotrichum asianum TaxID=702518 RepID=A0A8H3WHY4_9PEZI|nr:hypothetical protein GQ607_005478 [Colletotrichum asianum]